ncbi:SDR family NAD(P)-dependent oxidoreductase [Pseudoxanthomonas winnipegensis]|uniref:SDR family NAD(P)-dependent oxidoreductase n=1 Tax=Pseudoxanthomonas winnipegensis TaxID=2480810 RepID=A0A4Q8LWC5_9GAMM|nr:SDR family NAD(P)-dependent oxidoreductase [Pseudoxanthomonas winnipegensis]TAA27307.1 SDR family NAD(P)-dependent oxidoreductase [Pseudoxanthomonas winnipegensis]TAA35874.1 SDR family NAD(P)-dependent oxidoreductase [Pseudoxanthomonas winnipegensis]
MSLLQVPVRPVQSLAGRVVLISGAHGGLGEASARACAQAGATLVLLGRRPAKLARIYDACAQLGPEPLLYPLDLEGAAPDDYAELAQRIEANLGRLDGVLHCAAEFRGLTPLEHTDPAAFARAIHVNLTAAWWLSQACLPLLRRAADSALVFTLDNPRRVGHAYWGGYGVAQHGLAALVQMLHAELASTPVRVSALQPGPMRTMLRARAYAEDTDPALADADQYAAHCVTLLSPDGAERRGLVWNPLA